MCEEKTKKGESRAAVRVFINVQQYPTAHKKCYTKHSKLLMHVKRAYVSYLLLRIQSYLSKTATLGTEESGHCVEVAVMGR